MQSVHEAGHVLAAWLAGGRVERLVLHPVTISAGSKSSQFSAVAGEHSH